MTDLIHRPDEPTPFRDPGPGRSGPPHERSDAPDEARSIRGYVELFRRYWWLVGACALVGVGIGWWQVRTDRPEYRSQAVIRMVQDDRRLPGGMEGSAERALPGGIDRIASQVQVLRSRAVMGEVVDSLGLQLLPIPEALPRRLISKVEAEPEAFDEVRIRFAASDYTASDGRTSASAAYGDTVRLSSVRFAVDGAPDVEEASLELRPRRVAVSELQNGLVARTRDRTNVVDIDYVAHDPWIAEAVVNGVATVFQRLSARQAQQDARRRRIFVEGQLLQTDSLLADAQVALSDFRRREQVYSSTEEFATRQSGLMSLDGRREELLAERQMLSRLLDTLREAEGTAQTRAMRTVIGTPGLGDNPAMGQLISQLLDYQAALDSLVTGEWARASSHPDVVRVRSLLDETRHRLVDAVESQLALLDARLGAMDGLRERYAAEMSQLPDLETEEGYLAHEVETLRGVADLLRREHQTARMAEAVEGGEVEVVDLAAGAVALPGRFGRTLFLGLLLGLTLGGGVATILDRFDTRVRDLDDAGGATGLDVLGLIPRLERGANGAARPVPLTWRQGARGAEAFRTLRTMLRYVRTQHPRVLAVTSPGPASGKSTVSVNLAASLAQQGDRVLLVDADLRRPVQHTIFGQPREPGLSDVLAGEARLAAATHIVASDTNGGGSLSLLTCGTSVPNPSELLGSPGFERFLEVVRSAYDLVVLDVPPALAVTDAAVVGPLADGVLILAVADETDREALRQTAEQLRQVRAPLLGLVLNKVPVGRRYGSRYGYPPYEYGPEIHDRPRLGGWLRRVVHL